MVKKLLNQIILFDEKGEQTSFRFKNYQSVSLQGPVLHLIKDMKTHHFLVMQTTDDITELYNEDGKLYRISAVSFREITIGVALYATNDNTLRENYEFCIAESYEHAINLYKFFPLESL